MPLSVTPIVEYFDGTSWIDLTQYTRNSDGLEIEYGIRGSGPLDNMAGTGICSFTLGHGDREAPLFVFSPSHQDRFTGWDIGTPVRVWFDSTIPLRDAGGEAILTSDGDQVELGPALKFTGTIVGIDPQPGLYGTKHVLVTCEDAIGLLSSAIVQELDVQIDQPEMDTLNAIYAAIPEAARPPLVQLDDSIETFPVAMDDISGGLPAGGLIKDVLDSAFAAMAQRGDGVQFVQNRNTRTYADAIDLFTDDDMLSPDGLSAPATRNELWNRVDVEIAQIVLGTSVEVLAASVQLDTQGLAVGETEEIWMDYRDPSDLTVPIGGTDFIDLNDGATDVSYTANPNGTGIDRTPDMDIDATPFAGSVLFEITNTSAGVAYRQVLRQRGTAIRRYAPITITSDSDQPYGLRRLVIPLRYQTSRTVAAFIAEYIRNQYETAGQRPSRLAFVALRSERLLEHALSREPLDPIRVTEPVTGLNAAEAVIQSVRLLYQDRMLRCEWGLAPRSSFLFLDPWLLETVGVGELGETTILG